MVEHRSPKPRVVGSSPSAPASRATERSEAIGSRAALKSRRRRGLDGLNGADAEASAMRSGGASADLLFLSVRRGNEQWRRFPPANSSGRSAPKTAKVVWPTRKETRHHRDHGADHDHPARHLLLRRRFGCSARSSSSCSACSATDQRSGLRHMSRWYIIHAYSGFENKVRDAILAEAKRLGPRPAGRGGRGPDREGHRDPPRQEGHSPTASSSPATCSPS